MKSQFYIKREKELEFNALKILMDEKGTNITEVMNALIPVVRRSLETTFNQKYKAFKIDELIRIEQ